MTNLSVKIYKINTGHFQVTYKNPLTGKRKRHKLLTEKEAKNFKEELERQYHSKNFSHFSEMYVGHLIERHLKECPESKITERKNVFLSFCQEFNNIKLKYLTSSALKHWFAKIKAERDYSEKTLNTIKSQINYFFRFLEEDGLITQSPLNNIKFRRVVSPKRPRIVMSVDEVLEILRNAKAFSPNLLYPYLSCVAHTGARREEIVSLNREDIDLEMGLIHVKTTKNGRERFVRISPILETVLREHLSSHSYQPVFVTVDEKRLNSRGELPKLMNKFKAYFPMDKTDWGSHSLRHSFAYNFLKKGGQMYQLQAILGHRSIDVTVDLYGQLQAQDIACPSPYEP